MSFKLIVISSPTSIPNETELIISLFKAGLKIFHLRKPGMNKVRMKKLISAIPEKYHSRIVIHSNHSLSDQFSLKGIHFQKKEQLKATQLKRKGRTFSTSFHIGKDFLVTKPYDYILMSPISESISKPGYMGTTSLDILQRFLERIRIDREVKVEYIALGGLSDKNILKIRSARFHGAAMLGAIWMSKDPLKSFEKIKKKLK